MLGLKAALFICVGLMVMLAGDVKASEASRQNYEADERAFFASAEVEKAERSTLARSLALATGTLRLPTHQCASLVLKTSSASA